MKKWTIIVGRKVFVINKRIFIISLCLVSIVALLSAFNYYKIINLIIKKNEILSERKKIEKLHHKLKELKSNIIYLSDELQEIIELDEKERLLWGLAPIGEDIYKFGVGGISHRTKIEDMLLKISNAINFELSSFDEIFRKINQKLSVIEHTPSIWPTYGELTSGFGWRRTHFLGKEFHKGIDIANEVGTKVKATASGTVSFVGYSGGLGLVVEINHGYGYKTKYGHLYRSFVKLGDKVKRGEVIGLIGNSGISTGPHLHYEVQVLDKSLNPIHYIIPDTF